MNLGGFKKFLQPPGLRIIKTGIAVAISGEICLLWGIDFTFYAAIAVIFSVDKNILSSLSAGKSRLIGTFLGALFGLIFAEILPRDPVVSAFGVIVLIWMLNNLKLNSSIISGSMVFLSIMAGLAKGEVALYSIERFADTLIGILVAWSVNILILPYNNLSKIEELKSAIATQYVSTLEAIQNNNGDHQIDTLEKKVNAFESEIDIYLNQFTWHKKAYNQQIAQELLKKFHTQTSELVVLSNLRKDPELYTFYKSHHKYILNQQKISKKV